MKQDSLEKQQNTGLEQEAYKSLEHHVTAKGTEAIKNYLDLVKRTLKANLKMLPLNKDRTN